MCVLFSALGREFKAAAAEGRERETPFGMKFRSQGHILVT